MEKFFSKLRNNNPPKRDYSDFQSLIGGGLTSKSIIETEIEGTTSIWTKNNQYLTSVWQQEIMHTFKDFMRSSNNKYVVTAVEAMQKMVDIYQNKRNDMLKLGCIFPNLANLCLHKSTTAKIHPCTDSDKDLLEKIREDMVGGPSIVFARKAVVYETFT